MALLSRSLAGAPMYFRVRVAILEHTGHPFPSPKLKTMLECEIRVMCNSSPMTTRKLGRLIQEGVHGMQRGPKDKLPRPTDSSFPIDVTFQPWIQLTNCLNDVLWQSACCSLLLYSFPRLPFSFPIFAASKSSRSSVGQSVGARGPHELADGLCGHAKIND